MALLSEALKQKKFDVRMIERGYTKGHYSAAEVEKNQNQLPDDKENADHINLDEVYQGIKGKSGLR